MSPVMRACLGLPGVRCGRLIPAGQTRCPEHKYLKQRLRDVERGTPASRGYDAAYRRLRLEVLDDAAGVATGAVDRELTRRTT